MRGVRAGLGVVCLGLIAACQTTASNYNSQQVRPLAQAYCRQHGKRPIIRGAFPATSDTVLTGWVVGTKPYIFEFDCI
jgi:hypothetical protein